MAQGTNPKSQNTKILIIDDDEELNRLLTSYLGQHEFEVLTAKHPRQGMELLRGARPGLVILDVMLPERNGFELCAEIRANGPDPTVPIIMLTARGEIGDRVVGLELGADDYLPKPYEPRELVARIQSILRRTQSVRKPQERPRRLRLQSGELVLDSERATATIAGRNLELTTVELAVLCLLMENAGRTLSRDEIFRQVRGVHWDSMDRSVDMAVSRLRHKLQDDTRNPRYLKTIWGEGYRFVGSVAEAAND